MTKKPHALKGRKKSAASIAKRLATLARKKAMREAGTLPQPARATKFRRNPHKRVETRTFEQLSRDVTEAIWCLRQAIKGTRQGIATGVVSLTDITDEETLMYMAMRYLEGGLKV